MVFYCVSVPKFMFSEATLIKVRLTMVRIFTQQKFTIATQKGLGLMLKVRFEFNEHNLYKSDKQF